MASVFPIFILLSIAAIVAGYHLGLRSRLPRLSTSRINEGKCPDVGNDEQKGEDPVSSNNDRDDEKHASPPIIEPLLGFDWQTIPPRQLRPFKSKYHITMGLQASSPSELIVMDRNYRDRVTARRDILSAHQPMVVGCVSAGQAAVQELYTYLLGDYLPTRYPSMFALANSPGDDSKTEMFLNKVTGLEAVVSEKTDPVQALKILGETVEDDMFLLLQRGRHEDGGPGEHEAVAYVCCHPSGFDPSAKLGLVLADVHRPVPAYAKIGASMEKYFSRLEVGKSVKRVNWGIQTHPDLFSPGGNHVHVGEEVQEDDRIDVDKAMLRVELQTLTRLPRTRAILFSFKTYLYPLSDIKAEGLGLELADAVEGLKSGNAPGMWRYKGAVRWARPVSEYLRC